MSRPENTRLRVALLTLREFHSERQFDAIVVYTIHDWIDAGMNGPVPWPQSPIFDEWAEKQSWTNCDGYIGYKLVGDLRRVDR